MSRPTIDPAAETLTEHAPEPTPAPNPTASARTAASAAPRPRRGLRGRIADRVVAAFVIGAMELMRRLPERPLWWIGNVAGSVSYAVGGKRRWYARENLRRILGWMAANGLGEERYRLAASDPRALETLVRASFRAHAHYYIELARAPRFDVNYILSRIDITTPETVAAAFAERRPLILVGLHYGPVELPGFMAVDRLGLMVAPMESLRNERIQAYIKRTRAVIGVRILTVEEAGYELLAVLRRNEPIAIIADRDLTGGGIDVEMFGAPTKVAAGPALLWSQTGAPVYVAGVHRLGPGRYRGSMYVPAEPVGVSRRERSREMARQEALLFERIIGDAPEQWLAIFHPIWPDIAWAEHRRS